MWSSQVPDALPHAIPELDAVFALILTLDTIKPHPSLPKRLGPLLQDLQKPVPTRDPKTLAELIHALWITHPDHGAESAMADAITAIDKGEAKKAHVVLRNLSSLKPEGAEVSYKLAVASLMMGETQSAIRHLGDTLRIEPRHFAALSLFGQICIDCDRLYEARLSLQRAIATNPHLKGVKETILAINDILHPAKYRLNG